MEPDLDDGVESFIREAFDSNYELMRLENGRGLTPDGRARALDQVLLYWRKLREIAETVTDTEVKLTLPACHSPGGREFAIEGVVDIVREVDRTVMYDIKTHDSRFVRQNKELYERQLNVYAHIWHRLRGEPLDETAIIATTLPDDLVEAVASGDDRHIAVALSRWDPLIPLDFDLSRVDQTVADFGRVVDLIEDGTFAPRPVEDLNERAGGVEQRFATAVCRNCDARFSCASYREWALSGVSRSQIERRFAEYYAEVLDRDPDAWLNANMDVQTPPGDLEEDFLE